MDDYGAFAHTVTRWVCCLVGGGLAYVGISIGTGFGFPEEFSWEAVVAALPGFVGAAIGVGAIRVCSLLAVDPALRAHVWWLYPALLLTALGTTVATGAFLAHALSASVRPDQEVTFALPWLSCSGALYAVPGALLGGLTWLLLKGVFKFAAH